MAEYRITGIWKDSAGVISHYAVHTMRKPEQVELIGRAVKMSKSQTIALLENGNTAKTLLWNYSSAQWLTGEDIHVVNGNPKYLRTNHDNVLKDNLLHLIDYSFVF